MIFNRLAVFLSKSILLTDVHLWEGAKESFETEAGHSLLILY